MENGDRRGGGRERKREIWFRFFFGFCLFILSIFAQLFSFSPSFFYYSILHHIFLLSFSYISFPL